MQTSLSQPLCGKRVWLALSRCLVGHGGADRIWPSFASSSGIPVMRRSVVALLACQVLGHQQQAGRT